MNIFQKFDIIFKKKKCYYCKEIDDIILRFIEKGTYVDHFRWYIIIKYNNELYKLWIGDFSFNDLTHCYKCNNPKDFNTNLEKIYEDWRPSRKVQIKFWKWAEQYVGNNFIRIKYSKNFDYKEYERIMKS